MTEVTKTAKVLIKEEYVDKIPQAKMSLVSIKEGNQPHMFTATCQLVLNGKTIRETGEGIGKKAAEEAAYAKILKKVQLQSTNAPGTLETLDKDINYVGELQQYCQKNSIKLPEYQIGPSHQPIITVTCNVQGYTSEGTGPNKNDAKRLAAQKMCRKLNVSFSQSPNKLPQITPGRRLSVVVPSAPELSKMKLSPSSSKELENVPMTRTTTPKPTRSEISGPVAPTSGLSESKLPANPSTLGKPSKVNKVEGVPRLMVNPAHEATRVGPCISYFKHMKLGEKNSSSNVYEGIFKDAGHQRKVAVKRIADVEENKDLETLCRLEHVNVIKYILSEISSQGITFIAMEYADGTLESYIKESKGTALCVRKLLKGATKGLEYLHCEQILHRDIKPSNILVLEKPMRAKLADFGISKQVEDMIRGSTTKAGKGSPAWMPPEAFLAMDDENETKFKILPSFDIFSLGLTFFYAETRGSHPFSDDREKINVVEIQGNILKFGRKIFFPKWQHFGTKDYAMRNLLQSMLEVDPNKRPNPSMILEHPAFWEHEKKLKFVDAVIQDVKNCKLETSKKTFNEMYNNFCKKRGILQQWMMRLCPEMNDFILLQRQHKKAYKENSYYSLLDFIRDHQQHYEEWKTLGIKALGDSGETYIKYFDEKFPELIPFTYAFFQKKERHGMILPNFYKANDKVCFQLLDDLPPLFTITVEGFQTSTVNKLKQ